MKTTFENTLIQRKLMDEHDLIDTAVYAACS